MHDIYRSWRAVLGDAPAVAEAWGPPERTAAFARADELGQAFAFDILRTPWSAAALRRTVDAQLAAHRAVGALPAWVAGNHDIARVATRLGPERALALHLFLLALPGAFYLYAGDELGLPDADVPPEQWQDPQSLRSGGRLPNRDGARVPLPWTSGPGVGFTTGTPWLPIPATWGGYARDRQEADPTLDLVGAAPGARRTVGPLGLRGPDLAGRPTRGARRPARRRARRAQHVVTPVAAARMATGWSHAARPAPSRRSSPRRSASGCGRTGTLSDGARGAATSGRAWPPSRSSGCSPGPRRASAGRVPAATPTARSPSDPSDPAVAPRDRPPSPPAP